MAYNKTLKFSAFLGNFPLTGRKKYAIMIMLNRDRIFGYTVKRLMKVMKEIKAMNCFNVTFRNPEEILSFLNTVEKYDITMDMKRGRLIVDAKSLLGLMNLGLNNVAELRVYGDVSQLRQEISRYIAA